MSLKKKNPVKKRTIMLRPQKIKRKKKNRKKKKEKEEATSPLSPTQKKGNDPAQGKRKIKNKGNLKKPITSFEMKFVLYLF